MTDTERIDWLEEHEGCNLISDDGGRWAVSISGTQPIPEDDPTNMTIMSFIEAEEWQPSVREAIDFAVARAEAQ